jgi:hypothetical protein
MTTDSKGVLDEFAKDFPFCFVCWSRAELQIHHMAQGAGRKHVRLNLVRLCATCHERLHFISGEKGLSKGQVLLSKLIHDEEHYDPPGVAALSNKVGLRYGLEPLPDWALVRRSRSEVPVQPQMGEIDMACNARRKGKTGELEAAHELNTLLLNAQARRAQQYSGTESTADLLAPGLPNLYLEVKRRQSMNLHSVMDKCEEDCGGLHPVIMHRKDNTDWLVTFRLQDIREIVTALQRAM